MRPTRALEPGVLPTFRLFIALQLAHAGLGAAAGFAIGGSHSALMAPSVVSLLGPGLLLLYLSLPGLAQRLKSFYLPIGILWAAAGSILDPHIGLPLSEGSTPETFVQVMLWRQIIWLLIPLVVVGWQYSMHQVVLFSVLTATLNVALLARTLPLRELLSSSLLGIVAVQIAIFLIVGNMIASLMRVQREQRQRLTEAHARLAQSAATHEQLTISRERNRLARELHDVLAHTLSGVAVELGGARAMLRLDPERADGLLSQSLRAIREGLSETRRALQALRAQPLEDLGLALAVRTLAESYAGRLDIQIDLRIDPDVGEYPVEVQQCVYRIAQEALANLADHAQAQRAQVVLVRDQGQLRLIISDDGCGFDPSRPGDEHRYGLRGMRERAEMIGGTLSVESQVGKGTQISFWYGGHP
ncbi:MAG TPA: sensor histidine kinase [Anaerolineales bacterium]|nr:sensor histidine kinase [Anaerolineales bacterium]